MAKKILLVSLMVLLGSTGAWADLVNSVGDLPAGTYNTIDFTSQALNTYPSGSGLAIPYVNNTNTVTFTGNDGQLRIDNASSGSYNTTGNSLDNGPYLGGGSNDIGWYLSGPGFNTLKIAFSSPVQAFGFTMGAIDNGWTLTAYGTGNNMIETRTVPTSGINWENTGTGPPTDNTGEFYGLKSSSSNISYVLLTDTEVMLPIPANISAGYGGGPGSLDFIYIDNFQSSAPVSAVPIPGTALLLGSGLVALAGLRKKFFG
jgi:hypothetical protein